MLTTLNELGINEMCLKIKRAIYDKPTPNIILSGQKMEAFPLKTTQDKDVLLTIPTQHSIASSSQSNQARERYKVIQIERKEVKLSLFADDMILYLESPIVSPKAP